MPGSQPYKIDFGGGYQTETEAKLQSRWRLLPFLGPIIACTSGRSVSFRLETRLVRGAREPPPSLDMEVDNDVWLQIDEESIGDSGVNLKFVPSRLPDNKKMNIYTNAFYLESMGHGSLRIGIPGPETSVFTFEIWDPGLSAVNWIITIVAAGMGAVIGGVIGFLLASQSGIDSSAK